MAVLKGSIELAFKPISKEYTNTIPRIAKTTYFTFFKNISFFSLIFFCLIPINKANLFNNSCRAPKGQSQPQNNARPHIGMLINAPSPIITIAGSAIKELNPLPSKIACTNDAK